MILTRLIGDKGEQIAARAYKAKGYKVIARNFRCKFGELDIVLKKGENVVIAEVKTRKNENFAKAREFVDYNKQKRIKTTAKIFMQQNNLMDNIIRFDVVEVYTETKTVNIIENAFN